MLNSNRTLAHLMMLLAGICLAAPAQQGAERASAAAAPMNPALIAPSSTPMSALASAQIASSRTGPAALQAMASSWSAKGGSANAGSAHAGIAGAGQAAMAEGGDTAPLIRIGPGDLLNVIVFETPELSTSVRVNQDGQANLPVLGMVNLAGLSANEASKVIEQAYKSHGLLLDPHVSVFVAEYASQGASILGEVRAPGVYPTLGTRRLMDMLSLAGGVAPTAGKVATIIHQGDPAHPEQIAIQPTPASLHAQVNPIIQPGDTIVVAKSGVVYVIGDVLRPGGILVDNNERLSVIEAVSLAGGMNKTAAMSKTKIIRRLPTGREEVDLDLKHILYGKQADVLISDGDILFIPSSIGKTFLYRGIEAAIGLTTNYALFVH
jgi:polysaccharide export outer membrane protein